MSRHKGLPDSSIHQAGRLVVGGMILAAGGVTVGMSSAWAASGEGTAGAILARLPFGARSLGLGGPHGALGGSPGTMTVNPASLMSNGDGAAEAGFHRSAADTTYGGLAAAYAPKPWITAGVNVLTLTAGEFETWDAVGSKYTAQLQEDRVIGAAGAAALGPASLGIGLRHYASTVAGTAAGSALLGDLGARVRIALAPPPGWDPDLTRDPNPNGIDLSLAATGLFGSPDYGGAADAGPAIYRAGAALTSTLRGATSLLLASLDTPRETARLQAGAGWELRFPFDGVTASGRVGGRFRKGSGTMAAGLGVAYSGLSIDYAFVSADAPFAQTHHVTAGFDLAAFRRARRPRQDRFEPLPTLGTSAPSTLPPKQAEDSTPAAIPEPPPP